MIRVLFVCLGNICRSPMAEAVFRHKAEAAGLGEQIKADSAGTGHWHLGEQPHLGTIRVLGAHGIRARHTARLLSRRDLDDFDYVLVMDDQNLRDARALGNGKGKLSRLTDFAPQLKAREVPDPYYSGNFEEVYAIVDATTTGLLNAIRAEHEL